MPKGLTAAAVLAAASGANAGLHTTDTAPGAVAGLTGAAVNAVQAYKRITTAQLEEIRAAMARQEEIRKSPPSDSFGIPERPAGDGSFDLAQALTGTPPEKDPADIRANTWTQGRPPKDTMQEAVTPKPLAFAQQRDLDRQNRAAARGYGNSI